MPYSRIFISPHPDDIAYSCFGTIFNTVCDPSSDVLVSIFTRSVFPKYDKNCPSELEDEFSHERVLEDQNFCMWMKCDYVHLDFSDSSVRDDEDKNRIKEEVVASLRTILMRNSSANVYIPLACKNHVDHEMVRDAVIEIFEECRYAFERLFVYEDLPYASLMSENELKKQVAGLRREGDVAYRLAPVIVDVETCWKEKMKAFRMYMTQINQEHLNYISWHADRVGRNCRSERLWKFIREQNSDRRNFAWVSWEASRIVGGVGNVINNVLSTASYMNSAHRTFLIGPMNMPINVDSSPESLSEIAARLNSKILYAYGKNVAGIDKEKYYRLKKIEESYGVGVVYLRDYSNMNVSQTIERILIDFSYTVTSKNVYSGYLNLFLNELSEYLDINVEYGTSEYELFDDFQKQLYGNDLKRMLANLKDNQSSEYTHIDNDVVYGLLLAKPAIELLNALLGSDEICVLNVMDFFSLPTAFAAILERCRGRLPGIWEKKGNKYENYRLRTHYWASEVKPVRNIVEGYIDMHDSHGTDVPKWANGLLVRQLIKNCVESKRETVLTDSPFLRSIVKHPPVQFLQKIHLLDSVSAVSEQVRDELYAFNSNLSMVQVIPHGNRYIELNGVKDKLFYKRRVFEKLLFLADKSDMDWNRFSESLSALDLVLSIHISRPELCKKLERDLQVCHYLKEELKFQKRKIIHLFIIPRNQGYSRRYLNDLRERISEINKESNHFYCMLIEDAQWPCYRDVKGEIYLSRDDLYRAVDLNWGLSSYDSYGLSPLESLSCGALSIISAASGSSSHIRKIKNSAKNIVVIDYHSNFCREYISLRKESQEEYGAFMDKVNQTAASQIAERFPDNEDEQDELIKNGKYLSREISWENIVRKYFYQDGQPWHKKYLMILNK